MNSTDTESFTQTQEATSLPIVLADKVKVSLWHAGQESKPFDIIFVRLPDSWVRINLANKTFSVGDYEG